MLLRGLYSAVYAVVEKLPADELKFVVGFILCFFGGVLLGAIFGGVCCGLRRSGAFATPTLFDICSYIEGQDLRIGKLFHTSICHQVRCPYCCDRSIPHHGRPEFV